MYVWLCVIVTPLIILLIYALLPTKKSHWQGENEYGGPKWQYYVLIGVVCYILDHVDLIVAGSYRNYIHPCRKTFINDNLSYLWGEGGLAQFLMMAYVFYQGAGPAPAHGIVNAILSGHDPMSPKSTTTTTV